jgi:hypothetical protein
MKRSALALGLALLLLAACSKKSESTPAPPASVSAPSAPASAAAPASGYKPLPEADEVGRRLRSLAASCADLACRHQKCAPACKQWLAEKATQQEGGTIAQRKRQRLFMDCVGVCMDSD